MVNVIQGPARALVNDLVDREHLQTGNAIVTTVMALANVIANVFGAQFFYSSHTVGCIDPTDPILTINEPPLTNPPISEYVKSPYFILFNSGVIFLALSVLPTLILAKETKHNLEDGQSDLPLPH